MSREKPTMWNIVMVTLDAVRADHLGCYGSASVETPHIDRLASRGVLFEQAISHAPNTWVSHCCIFSGCLPPVHGVRAPNNRLSQHVTTLAEWLKMYGFNTAGFPGNNLVGRAQGIARGFDLFDDQWGDSMRVGEYTWRVNWQQSLKHAMRWARMVREPFFLWLHYIETHHLPEVRLPRYFREAFSPRWQYYAGKISYADEVCIGALVRELDRLNLLDRTILVILADHGEELHADDVPRHDGALKDDVVRVPLIILPPDRLDIRPGRVSSQVALIDLYPTLCELLRIPAPSHLQGETLVPLMLRSGSCTPHGTFAYLENWPKGYLGGRTKEWKLVLRFPPSPDGRVTSHRVDGLYHLPSDLQEERDLQAAHPSVTKYLLDTCLDKARGKRPDVLSQEEEARVLETLRSLGYI